MSLKKLNMIIIALIMMFSADDYSFADDEIHPYLFLLLSKKITLPPGVNVVESAGQVWMDRNLGATRVALSLNDEQAYGDLYQWGRGTDGHEKRNSSLEPVQSDVDIPGHGNFIIGYFDWRSNENNPGVLWQGELGVNNPCPSGFRLPTIIEWETERQSWISSNLEGAFASNLKLVSAGFRYRGNGDIGFTGIEGRYWSDREFTAIDSMILRILNTSAELDDQFRADGASVRCIMD